MKARLARCAVPAVLALALASCAYRGHEQRGPIKEPPPRPRLVPDRTTKPYRCDCPDHIAMDGSVCGGRSACSIEGGRVPVCPGYLCW